MPHLIRPLALTLVALSASAATLDTSGWQNGQFEVNALYGHTNRIGDGLDFYGGSVAGGYYYDNAHLFQLEVGALISNSFADGFVIDENPINTNQLIIADFKKREIQRIPAWVHYRYGVNFGPKDMFRLEAGPLLGLDILTVRTKYDLSVYEGGSGTDYTDRNTQDGGLAFEYGGSVALRVRLAERWSLSAGYRFVRSTEVKIHSRIGELTSGDRGVTINEDLRMHNMHYASVGVEYRF